MRPRDDSMDESVEARRQLWDLIKDIRFAMFTTRHGDGHLHSRPMTTQNSRLDEDANLWFFMSRTSESVAHITSDAHVNVSYADPGDDSYVSVSGTASVVDNPAKKQQLWSKQAQAWFPKGMNDPDLALVRVRISDADYWDVRASKLVQLYQMAKAAVSRRPPKDLGEHHEIRMG